MTKKLWKDEGPAMAVWTLKEPWLFQIGSGDCHVMSIPRKPGERERERENL